MSLAPTPGLHLAAAAVLRDGAGGAGGLDQRRQRDLVRVGEAGLLAADGAHADALIDAERALLDDAVLEAPGLGAGGLEVHVREIESAIHELSQGRLQLRVAETPRGQQLGSRDVERCAQSAWNPRRM